MDYKKMKDYLLKLFGNGAIFALILAGFTFIMKKWLEGFLDTRFKREIELTKAELDIQKERVRKLEEKRDSIYPEMLELIYRLKNQIRDVVILMKKFIASDGNYSYSPTESIGEELYKLTENLYSFRAFIDEETFEDIHCFKRIMQDSKVTLNRVTRPMPIPVEKKGCNLYVEKHRKIMVDLCTESIDELESASKKIEGLCKKIAEKIQNQVQTSLDSLRA